MTEYDSSPEAYNQFQRTQQRIANWADDTAHCAPQYKSPFVPRSDVQSNTFYNPRSASSSRSPPPSGHHGRRTPQSTSSHGYPPPAQANVRSPLRSRTIAVDTVSPNDSISQVSGPSHRSGHRRARSHSPSRRTSSSSRSHSHQSRHRSGTTYVVNQPGQYGGMQYVQAPQPMQYMQQQPQPAAYVVYPRDGKVQAVYPQPAQYPPVAHATQEHHGGLLRRIFGSQSGNHGRSRSVSVPRSGSRSRR